MSSAMAKAAPDGGFDTAPCGYISMDSEGRVQAANAMISEWLATPLSAIEGALAASLFSLPSRVVLETSVLPFLHLEADISGVSLDLQSRDGTNIPVIVSASSSETGTGRVTQLVLLKAGKRRSFERDLLEARAEAEARLSMAQQQGELREQFVAILGHDLRNPLAAFSASIRMLSRDLPDHRKKELLGLMQGSVQRMAGLVDNVLDFARVRFGGGIELELGVGDLESAIRQAVDELRAVHPTMNVRVKLDMRHDVECDTQRIGQMVSNLLGNALTHGDTAHPVTVDAATHANNGLDLSISNHGSQISASALEKLFDPFDRGDHEGYRKGLGLGLHIASEIAKAHGGTLSVQSDTDITRFTFQIPPGAVPG